MNGEYERNGNGSHTFTKSNGEGKFAECSNWCDFEDFVIFFAIGCERVPHGL